MALHPEVPRMCTADNSLLAYLLSIMKKKKKEKKNLLSIDGLPQQLTKTEKHGHPLSPRARQVAPNLSPHA